MLDKGYAFPLHTLALLRPDEAPPDEPRYVVPAPEGRLATQPALRRRGATLPSDACERAAAIALRLRACAAGDFAAWGFDEAWAAALRHWLRRLWAEEDGRTQLEVDVLEHTRRRRAARSCAEGLARRLQIAAALASVDLPRERSSRGELAVLDELGRLLARLDDPLIREALGRAGFGAEHAAQLAEACAWLAPARQRADEIARARQAHSDRIVVLRGALFGDLGRLCRAAPAVLPQPQAAALRIERLFALRRRRSAEDRDRPGPAAG